MEANKKLTTNFTKEEELSLLQSIEKHKNVIECKTTNKNSSVEKEKAWKMVLDSFNACNISIRTLEQIKSKYDNLKTKARKEAAHKKKYIKGTGGGTAIIYDVDPVVEAVLRIINIKSVAGTEGIFDCDVPTPKDILDVYNEEHFEIIEEIEVINNSSLLSNSGPPDSQSLNTSFCSPLEVCEQHTAHAIKASPRNDSTVVVTRLFSVNEDNLKASGTKNDNDHLPHHQKTTRRNESIVGGGSQKENWSTYVPHKLKQKPHQKLRPVALTAVGEAKQMFYKRKLDLLEQNQHEESEARKKREQREVEEHEKKMKLLDLEIECKQKELNKFKV